MIPVLYKFTFNTQLSQWFLYGVAVLLVGYSAFAGWRGAHGPLDPKTKEFRAPTRKQEVNRALVFAVVGAVLARFGLYYALPAGAFLGAKGDGIPIHTYGVLLASGFILAVSLGARLALHEWPGEEGERKREEVLDMAFWVLIGGLVGSRVLFILVNWKDYAADPKRIFDLGGGLVFYGGLMGALVASFLFTRKHNIDFLRLADLAMPLVSLGQCLGRLGCFSAGCCWGDIARPGVKWAVEFPGVGLVRNLFGQASDTASLAFQSQSTDSRWVVEATAQVYHQAVPGAVRISEWVVREGHTFPLHPTQLYESIGQLCLFAGLLTLRRFRRFHGQIFGLWLMAYAVLRTTVELFRGDVERGTLNGLLNNLGLSGLAQKVPLEAWYNISTSQFISLCMFTLGATLLYRRGKQVLFGPAARSVAEAA